MYVVLRLSVLQRASAYQRNGCLPTVRHYCQRHLSNCRVTAAWRHRYMLCCHSDRCRTAGSGDVTTNCFASIHTGDLRWNEKSSMYSRAYSVYSACWQNLDLISCGLSAERAVYVLLLLILFLYFNGRLGDQLSRDLLDWSSPNFQQVVELSLQIMLQRRIKKRWADFAIKLVAKVTFIKRSQNEVFQISICIDLRFAREGGYHVNQFYGKIGEIGLCHIFIRRSGIEKWIIML